MLFEDRISTYPGRVLITPTDGTAPFTADIAWADEPVEEGTPLDAEHLNKISEEIDVWSIEERVVGTFFNQPIIEKSYHVNSLSNGEGVYVDENITSDQKILSIEGFVSYGGKPYLAKVVTYGGGNVSVEFKISNSSTGSVVVTIYKVGVYVRNTLGGTVTDIGVKIRYIL